MENNIIEGNKAIADFMGWAHSDDVLIDRQEMAKLKYHASWYELMPVVEKIEKEPQYAVSILKYNCTIDFTDYFNGKEIVAIIYDDMPKIEGVWKAVVQFIKWYNQQQQNNEQHKRYDR